MNCEVCELQKQNEPELILFENESWVSVLRPDDQEYLGKSIVSCKQHVATLGELSLKQWDDYAEHVQFLERHISQAFSPTHFNWQCLMNLGAAEGITHVHWHCIPRYEALVEFAGETFTDQRWPKSVRTMQDHRSVGSGVLRQIATTIRLPLHNS